MLPGGGFKIAKVLGIEIYINPTWLIVFVLVGVSLGDTFRNSGITGHPGTFPGGPWPWIFGFATAAVFFVCLLAHELSHSFVAKRKGIKIRRITLFLFGGVAEMSEDVSDATSELQMAIAGPLMTFFLAGLFYLIYRLLAMNPERGPLWLVPLWTLAFINAFVGVFNLLPGFPLDGGRVFRSILWMITGDLRKATRAASYGGQAVAVLMGGFGLYLLVSGENYLSGVWLILIAAFIFQLSRASYQQTLLQIAVADTRVKDLMYTHVPTIPEYITLTDLRNKYFETYHLPALPVADKDGNVIGLVSREDLAATNPSEWDVLNAGRIARPIGEDQKVSAETRLDKVMRRVMRAGDYLLVMDDGHVEGILTVDELMRYIRARVNSPVPPAE